MKDAPSSPADESRIRDYLAGRLDAAAAERFEQRMFEDDELAAEVQRALEIRAATAAQTPAQAQAQAQVSATPRPSRPPRRVLYALATAASLAFLAVAVVSLQRPAEPPVFRGVEQRMRLEVEIAGAAMRARWEPVADAASYELQVLAADGRVLRSVEADETRAELDLGASAAAAAFVEVEALDAVGQTLQRSDRVALPSR